MEDGKDFLKKYKGAIFGVIIALVILMTGFLKLILGILVLVTFGFLGHYIQNNKEEVKERLKQFISRM